ncbi:MAG: hypothetical protein JKY27_04655 [Magnetovibrio sp.]|nr:hypothetical protein [Magnetovibrio sp.]
MANLLKVSVLSLLALLVLSTQAEAIALNRCAKLVRDAAGRETVVNVCKTCITVNLERRRPGQNIGTPNLRQFIIPNGSRQPLPFRGPGITRITSEDACPGALGN